MLALPLEADVGNAIVDYILNERPKSKLTYIFLSSIRPYRKLNNSGSFSSTMHKYMEVSGVVPGDMRGLHSFRRSMGTWLLDADVPLSTISEVLGHANSNSTKPYLSMNQEKLRTCALSLEGIEVTREELLI
jgi:integrase